MSTNKTNDYARQFNITMSIIMTTFIITLGLQFFTIFDARQQMEEAILERDKAQMELAYLQGKYQELYVFMDTPTGERLVRLVSIDGGKNYFEITQNREILQPAYFHQRYPDQQLAELEPLKDKIQ